jgi:hypothetical protein
VRGLRPDNPIEKDTLPLQAVSWFRLDYSMVKKDNELYIATHKDSTVTKYQPFDTQPPKDKKGRNYGQPEYPEEWNDLPHLHLARLNTEKEEGVLDFVNSWGLLGLWKCKDYLNWPLFSHHKEFSYRDKDGSVFSSSYINSVIERKSRFYYHRYQEPLIVFIKAVKEFQQVITLLDGSLDDKSDAEEFINKYIAECKPVTWYVSQPEQWTTHWQTPSQLHTCYLLIWMDLLGLRKYRYCKHDSCGKIFIQGRPNEDYCSFRCKENAKVARYRARQKEALTNGG